jgi:hypothetical protein
MIGVLNQLDAVLRGGSRTDAPSGLLRSREPSLGRLLAAAAVAAFSYGAVMGTFELRSAERLLQVLFSATKVPILLLVTFALCLPSFFVINTLLGLRDDFGRAMRALLVTQCALTLVLLAMAPFTAFWYVSSGDYPRAILFNAAMFAVASIAAQRVLRREYAPLLAREPKHRQMVRLWLAMYAFVGIQMGWMLRPFIGRPTLPVRFFRENAWGNAYQEVLELVWKQLAG